MRKYKRNKSYIRWTDEEKYKLTQETINVYFEHNQYLSILRCLHIAQQRVLNKNRMRNITTIEKVTWFNEYLQKFDTINPIKLAFENEINKKLKKYNNQQKVNIPVNNVHDKKINDNNKIDKQLVNEETLRKIISEEFDNKIGDIIEAKLKTLNIAETIVEYLEEDLDKIKISLSSVNNNINNEAETKKSIVLLVNLLPEQFQIIEKRFSNKLELISWRDTEDSIDKLKSYCAKANRIYAMTGKMGHATDDIIVKVNKPAYRRFTGSTSNLKRIIANDLRQGVI